MHTFRSAVLSGVLAVVTAEMNFLKSLCRTGFAAGALVAGILGAGSAFAAQDPNVFVTVTPTPPAVTLSRAGLVTFASDLVLLTNGTTNDLNRVSFTGTMSVKGATGSSDPLPIDSIVPVSGQPAGCAIGPTPSSVTCNVMQLVPGASTAFAVVVQAPTAGASIQFAWTFSGTEGKSTTGKGCCVATGSAATALVDPLSDTGRSQVKSFVKTGGGLFFTGAGAVPNAADPFSTRITIGALPAGFDFVTASVIESPASGACTDFTTCFQSQITIPDLVYPNADTDFLTILLRADKSIIRNGTSILGVLIQYDDGVNPPIFVGDCPSPSQPLADGVPCIAKRVDYKNKTVPNWTPELDGDFEWTILNRKNGSLKIQ